MIRSRVDRLFSKYLRTGDARVLTKVLDLAAPELWRLAAHLCRTRHDAEDAVQSTFLAAIEAKQDWDEERPLMPWLVGILINRARERRRQLARTVDPDRIAVPAAIDPAHEASEREFEIGLERVLRQIHEPFRSVVAQHLVRGMTTKDIACELGIPAATVRTRLHRGIQQLRKRLPSGVVALALVPAQMPAQSLLAVQQAVMDSGKLKSTAALHSGLTSMTVIGGLAMKKVLAVAAVLLVGIATWQLFDVSPAGNGGVGQPPTPPAQQGSVATRDTTIGTTPEDSHAASNAPPPDRVAVGTSGQLAVLVRNAKTLQPLPGINVTAYTPPPARSQSQTGSIPTASSPTQDDPAPSMAQGTTDAGGRVTLRIATGRVRVGANHGVPHRTIANVQPDEVTEHVHDIPASLAADVLVLNERGEPIPFAAILGPGESDFEPREVGKTDAHGRWQEHRTERSLMVRAATPDLAASNAQMLTPEMPSIVITLRHKSATIHGMVLDESGKPVPGAMILFESTQPHAARDFKISVKCDDQGRYHCSWLHEGPYRILVTLLVDRTVQRSGTFRGVAVVGECPPTHLQLHEGASLAAYIRRPNGQPLINFPVTLEPIALDTHRTFVPWLMRSENTGQDGRCTQHHVMAGRYKLSVPFEKTSVKREIELRDGELYRFDYMFPGAVTMTIEVVDEDGKPRANIRVALRSQNGSHALRTDATGRARFEGLGQQDYEITLSESNTRFSTKRHEVTRADVVRLAMPKCNGTGRIVGRFVAPGGELPSGLRADLHKGNPSPLQPNSVPIDVDPASGAFVIKSLPEGRYGLWAFSDDQALGEALGARHGIEVVANRTADLGSIRLGTGKIRIETVGTNATDKVIVGISVQEGLSPFSDRWPTNLPAASYQVLVWGETIRPSFAEAHVEIGRTTAVRVEVTPGVRTEAQLPEGLGILDVHMPDGSTISLITFESTWVRGLAPGRYRLQHRGMNGERSEAEFEVGTTPGATIRLRGTPR